MAGRKDDRQPCSGSLQQKNCYDWRINDGEKTNQESRKACQRPCNDTDPLVHRNIYLAGSTLMILLTSLDLVGNLFPCQRSNARDDASCLRQKIENNKKTLLE